MRALMAETSKSAYFYSSLTLRFIPLLREFIRRFQRIK